MYCLECESDCMIFSLELLSIHVQDVPAQLYNCPRPPVLPPRDQSHICLLIVADEGKADFKFRHRIKRGEMIAHFKFSSFSGASD